MNFREQYVKFLKESVLNTFVETASSKTQQYKVTSPEEFEMLIAQDPTYDSSKDDGDYIDWIFDLWRKYKTDEQNEKTYNSALDYKKEHPDAQLPLKKEKLSQDKFEDFEKIRDLLSDYEKYKKDINKKINLFSSVAELASAIRSAKNKDVSVDKQAQKNYNIFRAAMADGLEVVYDGPNFIIGVPTTYEASAHFKKPVTDWCTAYPEKYKEYMDDYGGKYYIHLNKHTGELYQAHYESDQFNDASNIEIDKEKFITNYPELKSFYDKIWDMNNANWWVLHNKQPTEKEKVIAGIYNDPSKIKTINNPTEEIQLVAVKKDGWAIEFIENPSETVQLAAVKQNGLAIQFIRNPSEEVQLAAVKQNGGAIYYIQNPSEEVKLTAVQRNGSAIRYIENPSEEVQLATVQRNGLAIQYIKNPSEKVQLAAVQQNGFAIRYIKNPSEYVQITAVLQNKHAIQYIKNPSRKVKHASSLA